jgi:hypothetical protein
LTKQKSRKIIKESLGGGSKMMRLTQANKAAVLEKLKQGRIDGAGMCGENFVETIVKKMLEMGITEGFGQLVRDKRAANARIPMSLLWTLAITAKMKVRTSMSDIPYAIEDGELLAKMGWNLSESGEGIGSGLMDEGEFRHLFGDYSREDLIGGYNECVQRHILPKADIRSAVHLLDCTKITVKLSNQHYEGSTVVKDEEGAQRGYKLATLRGIVGDGGVIEEIRFGTITEHDIGLSRQMILESPMLKAGEVLINDRGFLSREILNRLKRERGVDSYVPLKKNMIAYDEALRVALMPETVWTQHPNKRRKAQRIAFVSDLGPMWVSEKPEQDVPVNGCVVWDTKAQEYYVFITTDTRKTARQIIMAYEMRPEIEEDYRQLKDFWCLQDFKSTKLCLITFHIVATLLGYLMFQLYVATDEGKAYAGKSLPVILKKYDFIKRKEKRPKSLILFAGPNFAIFPFLAFIDLYAALPQNIRTKLQRSLSYV